MSADVFIANSLRIASEDLDGAKVLAQANNRNAIYLCEQAAEKIIRAVLTSEGVAGGTGHHLDGMVDLVPDANPLKPLLRAVESLAAYATTYRYPTPSKIKAAPSVPQLTQHIAEVEAALTETTKRFGVELTKPNTPAKSPGPVR